MTISYQMGINTARDTTAALGQQIDAPAYQQQQQQQQPNQKQQEPILTTSKEEEEEIDIKEEIQDDVVPKYKVPLIYKKEQNRIDNTITDEKRCKQFGVKPLVNAEGTPYYDYAKKRKIFLGTMLADESNDVMLAHATEVYNMYDGIAFVESNTTHLNTPRSMHYGPNSLNALRITKGELFGRSNKTHVKVNYYYANSNTRTSIINHPNLEGMNREVEQRSQILQMWIELGMEKWDVGIMSDLDEIVSRDFLNALKVCDFPKLRYNGPESEKLENRPTCQTPKIILSTIFFEGSPKCIKKKIWFHPDIILGNCLVGIGDNSGRVIPTRQYQNEYGERIEEYGSYDYKNYPKDVVETNRYPLWDARDIRTVNGNDIGLTSYVGSDYEYDEGTETSVYGTAYHLHNWFNDIDILRNKYATYGHSFSQATIYPLSKINKDLDLFVRCNRNLGQDGTIYNKTKYPTNVGDENKNRNAFEYYNYTTITTVSEINNGTTTSSVDMIRNPRFNETKTNDNSNKEQVVEGKVKEKEEKEWIQFGGNRPIYFMNQSYVQYRNQFVQQLLKVDENKYGSIYD